MTDAMNINTLKGKILMMAVVLATMLVALAATSKPADAYTITNSGRPGGVEAYKIQGSHHNGCANTVYRECYVPWVVGTGPVVYRSPATTGNQTIVIVYDLYKWSNGSWAKQSTQNYFRTLSAGYSKIQMPRPDFLPNSGGYFRVVTGLGWANSSGQNLGNKVLDYNESGDYMCNTRFTSACSSSDWVYLKSPGL